MWELYRVNTSIFFCWTFVYEKNPHVDSKGKKFAASLLSTQHYGVWTKDGLLGIGIIYPRGTTYISCVLLFQWASNIKIQLIKRVCSNRIRIRVMVFNATFNNISAISWRSVLLVEETGENHRPAASHWQTLSHNVVSSTPRHERGSNSQL